MQQSSLVGVSAAHQRVISLLARVAPTDAEVMVRGPSGVGKELYARYVHGCSKRSAQPFVAVNCGAIPSSLFENEFFGHAAGAFTGARRNADGLLAEAEGGTLFLDEVDALAKHDQVKLLRVLQEREFRRLGESFVRRANVRIVSGTNADLTAKVRGGEFRQDLFFRLHVVPIAVDPLRDRPDDVQPLLEHFAKLYAAEYQVPAVRFSEEARAALERYAWPGNVRELQNCVRYLSCLQLARPVEPDDLPLHRDGSLDSAPTLPFDAKASFQDAKTELVDGFERNYLVEALRRARGNVTAAARASGKHRRAFFELLRKHRIDARQFRG
jgi:two-component system, NtrC family, response regulator GlrR